MRFSDKVGIKFRLAYYPPYHSKYNPIERVWGILENHWNGETLDSDEKALGLVRSMTYNSSHTSSSKIKENVPQGRHFDQVSNERSRAKTSTNAGAGKLVY